MSGDLDSFEEALAALLGDDPRLAPDGLEAELRRGLPDAAADRFELGETLGQGGFGVVVHAVDRTTGGPVALKLMAADGLGPEQRARVRREFRAGRRLRHPNLVRTYDLFEAELGERVWAFSMERMQGSLRDRLKAAPLPLSHALGVAQDLLAALDHLHAEGVVHRDVKPENVLLGPPEPDGAPGQAKLGDLGIARFGELGDDPSARGMTGTPAYMPPEAFEEGRFDPRGDLYALGLVILEALTGAHPLEARSTADWPRAQREEDPRRPEGLPDPVWAVLAGLLAKRPEDRPRTARAAAEALAAAAPPQRPLRALRGGAYVAAPPLIGRSDEVARIDAWLDGRLAEVPMGPPLLWLEGGAGVGKSRLLRHLLAGRGEVRVLHGRGRPNAQRPLAALSGILLELAPGAAPEPGPEHPEGPPGTATLGTSLARGPAGLRSLEPVTASGFGAPTVAPTSEAHAEEAQLAQQRRHIDALLRACDRAPLLLVVEDLHACDEASLELLGGYARALAAYPRPAALLVTSRPPAAGSPQDALLGRLRAAALVSQLLLQPLDHADVQRLVRALLVDDPRADGLAQHLHAQGTTPLLVIQTLHLVLARGALDNPAALDLGALPATVEQIVGERVGRLSGVAKELLAMAAVLGSEVPLAELAAALGTDPLGLMDHLDEAERAGVVHPGGGAEQYRFTHDALREALLAGLGEPGRALHRRAAAALLQVHPDPDPVADRLAHHLAMAEDWPGAWTWGRRAGALALAQHAFQASAERFEAAVSAAARAGITPDVHTLRQRGDALLFSGRNDAANDAYRTALAGVEASDEDTRISILGRMAELEYRASRLTHALEPLEALLPRLGAAPHPDDASEVEAAFLRALLDDEPVAPVAAHARARAEVLCNTYRSLAEVAYYHRPDRKALYRAEAGLLALRLGSTSASAQALALSAFMAAQEGRFDVAEASTRRALPAAHACGDAIALMFAQSMTAAARTMSGAPAEGVASSAEAWALAQRVAEPLRMMSVASIHALGLAATGDADGASEVARTMRALGQRYGYARVRELGVVCSAAADQAGLRFEGVWEHALAADDMAATGSHMLAFQLRAYGALAEAFLNPDGIDPTFAIEVAEGWHAAGFESMLCNPDAHALLVAALGAPAALSPALVSRLEARRAAATEAAVRNRAKTVLSLGAAGLLDLALGRAEGQRALDEGLAHAHRYGLGGDRAVLEAAARRIRGAPTR